MVQSSSMRARRARPRGILVGLTALLIAGVAGCGVLNPSLVGTTILSSTESLDNPEGTIVIVVMNTTSSLAAARFEITKRNGGTVDLTVPVLPFDGDPANEGDRAMVVQDCDITSIQLVDVLASLSTGGIQQFGQDLAPLTMGDRLSCGKVVALTITGTEPNLLVTLQVF